MTHHTCLSMVVPATIPPFLKLMDPGSKGQETEFPLVPISQKAAKSDEIQCSLPAIEDKWQVITEGVEEVLQEVNRLHTAACLWNFFQFQLDGHTRLEKKSSYLPFLVKL